MNPQAQTMDQDVINLAKSIRQVESGGNFNAKGKSNEEGAYQWTPETWRAHAQQALGNPDAPKTPSNQNAVAYTVLKSWKDQGLNPAQIAAKWNSGSESGWEKKVGVNKFGVKYDVPKYVKSVTDAYQTIKGGGNVGMDPQNPSSISGTEMAPVQSDGKPSVGGFLGNVVKSGANFVGGVAGAVAHPIDTLSNIANLGAGGLEKAAQATFDITGLNKFQKGGPIDTPESKLAENFGQFYKERYGGLDNIKKTLYEDPVGAAADASALLGGAGAVAKGLGAAEVASGLSKASNLVDPIAMAGKATGGLLKLGGRAAGESLGATTGVGYGPIREAFMNPSSDVTAAMRGKVSGEDVLNTAREGINTIKQNRGATYRTDLANLAEQNPNSLDISPLTNSIEKKLSDYKIAVNEDGLDFSRSPVSSAGQSDIEEAVNIIKDWGSKVGDRTPEGLHILQQKLGDMIPKTGQARAFITSLKSQLTDILNTAKGFPEMQAKYAADSSFIDDLNRSFDSGNTETAIKKLTSITRRNNEFKIALAKQLEEATGQKIIGKVAGMELNPIRPRGLTGNMLSGGEILTGLLHPQILTALPFSSPRIVGELANALGIGRLKMLKVVEALKNAQVGNTAVFGQRINASTGDSKGLLPSLLLQSQIGNRSQTVPQ